MKSKTITYAMAAALIVVAVISIAPLSMYESDATDASNDDFVTKVTSATAGDTIKLTGNVNLTGTGGAYFVTVDEQLTIDLNGYSIKPADDSGMTSYPYAIRVADGGDLTITDTSASKDGSIESRGINVAAQGKLTLENGTVKALDVAGAAVFCRGTFVMNGGTLESAGGYDSQNDVSARALVVMVDASGSTSANATINNGTVKANYTAITNMGTLKIVDATVSAQTAIDNDQGATATIEGGKFTSQSTYPLIRNDGTINIKGGTFSNDNYVALWNESTATISGGTFESKSRAGQTTFGYAITSAKGQLTINENDGEVSVSGGFGAVSVTGGTANISAGTFRVIQDTSGDGGYYALYVADEARNGNPDVTVSGGDFISYKNSTVCVQTYSDSTSQFLKISGGDFSIADNSGNRSSIISRNASNPDGNVPSASVSGGTFCTPLPDTVTVPTGSLEGVNSKGETVVAQAVQVTVDTDGTSKSVSVAKGTCLPVSELPTEQAGLTYTYTLDGTATTRDALLKTDLNGGESIAITSSAVPTDHTITFYIDGTLYATKTVEDGETLTDFPADPTKAGYDFDGWEVSGQPAVFTNVTSDFSVDAAFTLKAPKKVTVELSGPLYEGGSVTATVTAEHELEGVTFLYAMKDIYEETTQFGESPTFTIDHAGEYIFGVVAVNGDDVSEDYATSEIIEVTYSAQPGYDDDEDLPPFVPGQTQGSDDDSVTIVACAAAAVVAALMAVFLIVSYRKD